jgi:hypothetical protein
MQLALLEGFASGASSASGSGANSASGSASDADGPGARRLGSSSSLSTSVAGASSGGGGSTEDSGDAPAASLGPVCLDAVRSRGAAAPDASRDGGELGGGTGGSSSGSEAGGTGADAGADEALRAFILENLTQPAVRAARVAALAGHARGFAYPRHERLMSLGTMFSRNVE